MRRIRLLAVSLMLATVGVAGATPSAVAEDGSNADKVTEREILQAKLDPDGTPSISRLYSQITVSGAGTFTVDDPTSTDGLRNLDGFGRPTLSDDAASWTVTVDGEDSFRTVSSYDNDSLPLQISAAYLLDGESIAPADLVGRTGRVEVIYTIRNVSAVPTEIEFKDGTGEVRTETVDVPLPLAGSLSLGLPPNFVGVNAPGGVVAGDGRGGTKLSWSLITFEPLGAPELQASFSARVTDAIVPSATMQAVPVTIDQTPLNSGNAAYTDAAKDTTELTAGAMEIDANVMKLASGAGELLSGLSQLAAGAAELQAGLARAASGSGELSDGLNKADDGGTELASGLGQLEDGADRLSDGLGAARTGAGTLAGGLRRLDDGAGQLSAGMADANEGGAALNTGARRIANGTDDAATGAGTILAGLDQIAGGLKTLENRMPAATQGVTDLRGGVQLLQAGVGAPGIPGTLRDGLAALAGDAGNSLGSGGLPAANAGISAVKSEVDNALADGGELDSGLDTMSGALAAQVGLLDAAKAGCATPVCVGSIDGAKSYNAGVAGGLTTLRNDLATNFGTASGYLAQIGDGLSGAITGVELMKAGVRSGDPSDPGLVEGLAAVDGGLALLSTKLGEAIAGVSELSTGAAAAEAGQAKLTNGLDKLAAGTDELAAGTQELSAGLTRLSDGSAALAAGAGEAAAGSLELRSGLTQLDDGGQELAAGASKAASGGAELSDGLHQLNDGGSELASGLGDAETGSGKLADGLVKAADGGGKVAAGADELSRRGTSVLAAAVDDATAEQTRKVALIEALDERGRADGMPAGAPADAESSAVYSFELAGADGMSQETVTRILLTAVALAALVGLALLTRRFAPGAPPATA